MTTTTFDAAHKRQCLEAEIAEMLATELPVIPEEDSVLMDSGGPTGIADELKPVEEVGGSGPDSLDPTSNWEDSGFDYGFYQTHPQEFTNSNNNVSRTHAPIPTKGTRRRITPDQATTNLYEKWKASLPLLVDDLLAYMTGSVGAAIQPIGSELEGRCCSLDVKTTKVDCLYFDCTLPSFFELQVILICTSSRFQDHRYPHMFLLLNEPGSCTKWTLSHCTSANAHGDLN